MKKFDSASSRMVLVWVTEHELVQVQMLEEGQQLNQLNSVGIIPCFNTTYDSGCLRE